MKYVKVGIQGEITQIHGIDGVSYIPSNQGDDAALIYTTSGATVTIFGKQLVDAFVTVFEKTMLPVVDLTKQKSNKEINKQVTVCMYSESGQILYEY